MKNLSKFGLYLSAIHLGIVIFILQQDFEGSWGSFFLFILDLPISLLILLPMNWNKWMLFGVVGSLWWYVVGIFLAKVVRKKITD